MLECQGLIHIYKNKKKTRFFNDSGPGIKTRKGDKNKVGGKKVVGKGRPSKWPSKSPSKSPTKSPSKSPEVALKVALKVAL